MFFMLLMLVVVLRRESIALVVLGILVTMFSTLVSGGSPTMIFPSAALGSLILIFLLYRYGLLALSASLFFAHLWVFYPITSDFRAWYAIDFVIAAIVCIALAAYACYASMGGQRMFSGKFLED